jgi:hypothetical protein
MTHTRTKTRHGFCDDRADINETLSFRASGDNVSAIEYDLESQHLSFSNLLSERMQLAYEFALKRLGTRRYTVILRLWLTKILLPMESMSMIYPMVSPSMRRSGSLIWVEVPFGKPSIKQE